MVFPVNDINVARFYRVSLTIVICPTGYSANKMKTIKLGMAVEILGHLTHSAPF